MKRIILDTTKKDKDGKTIFTIKGMEEIPQSVIDEAIIKLNETSDIIKRISYIDLNKLKKPFTI